jgi:putative lipoprotein
MISWPALGFASDEDPWLGRDKAKHFGVSAALAVAGYAAATPFTESEPLRLVSGGGLALGLGLGKEIADRFTGGHPSLRDLTWDVAGTATGLLTAWLIDRWLFGAPAQRERARMDQNLSASRPGSFGVISPAHVHVRQ